LNRGHTRLVAWQSAMQLVSRVYRITLAFPRDERFGLTQQMRRAAVSVPSNIAEGAARGSDRDYLRFLYIARGSLAELETQLLICRQLGYCSDLAGIANETERVFAQLAGLIRKINSQESCGEAPDVSRLASRISPKTSETD